MLQRPQSPISRQAPNTVEIQPAQNGWRDAVVEMRGEASTTIRMGGVGEEYFLSEVEGYLNRERQPLEGWRQISHLAFGRTRYSLLPIEICRKAG